MRKPSGRRPGRPRKFVPDTISDISKEGNPLSNPVAGSSASTVTVACKVPNGLILRLGKMDETSVPVLGGGMRTEKVWRYTGQKIDIKGPKRAVENGDPESPIADGYALTFGVPADQMAKWMEDNADSDVVRNKLIVVHEKRAELKAMTHESRDTRTGLEPMSQTRDRRLPKSSNIEPMVA